MRGLPKPTGWTAVVVAVLQTGRRVLSKSLGNCRTDLKIGHYAGVLPIVRLFGGQDFVVGQDAAACDGTRLD
jgi:hypothetical protein